MPLTDKYNEALRKIMDKLLSAKTKGKGKGKDGTGADADSKAGAGAGADGQAQTFAVPIDGEEELFVQVYDVDGFQQEGGQEELAAQLREALHGAFAAKSNAKKASDAGQRQSEEDEEDQYLDEYL